MSTAVPILTTDAVTFTVEELAKLLKVSTFTIDRRIKAGQIRTLPRQGRQPRRIGRDEVFRLAGVAATRPAMMATRAERAAEYRQARAELTALGVPV